MRTLTKRWSPDRRDIVLEMPKGSQLLGVRMSLTGDCQASFAVPDGDVDAVPFPLAICVENEGILEGAPEDWRHVGTWTYNSGRVAHAFQPRPQQAVSTPKKRGKPRQVDATRKGL